MLLFPVGCRSSAWRRFARTACCGLILLPFAAVAHSAVAMAQAAQPSAAHDIADTWQGILHAGRDLRSVIKITKEPNGSYKGVFYSIDQGSQPLNLDSVTLQGSEVKFTLSLVSGKFQGKLSADGKTISGTWDQGTPMPLVLERTTPQTAWEIPAPPPPQKPMDPSLDPNFEAVTIKPDDSGATRMQALIVRGRQFATKASSLEDLICFAYSVQKSQIVNAPGWVESVRYDITAVPEQEGVPSVDQLRSMVRKMITERFKIAFHKDKKELSAYVLSVAKTGSKLKPTQIKGNLPGLGFRPVSVGLAFNAINATTQDFAVFLQSVLLDRPVVDKTEIQGRYDIQCTFSPDETMFGGHPPRLPKQDDGTASIEQAPNFFDALQQGVGLKMTAEKTPVDVLVLDHVEKPSDN